MSELVWAVNFFRVQVMCTLIQRNNAFDGGCINAFVKAWRTGKNHRLKTPATATPATAELKYTYLSFKDSDLASPPANPTLATEPAVTSRIHRRLRTGLVCSAGGGSSFALWEMRLLCHPTHTVRSRLGKPFWPQELQRQ